MLRISYVTGQNQKWFYGKTWILTGSLEGGDLEFITDWMQLKTPKEQWEYSN